MVSFRVMDKSIARYLERRGVRVTVPFAKDVSFSERAPDFFRWFHRSVLNLDTAEYRREFWREASRTGRTIGHVPYTLDDHLRRRGVAYRQEAVNLLAYSLLMGGAFAAWMIRRQIDRHIRRLRRPTYYETELARRKGLAQQRRKLRERTTTNPCPSPEQLLEAFGHAKDSPASMIRFGSLLEDLECHVDNSAIFDEKGNIVGRRGGIRQYLRSELPELAVHYKTVMKYKALAKRFRQAVGISDPVPASAVLPDGMDDVSDARSSAPCRGGISAIGGEAREFASEQNFEREDRVYGRYRESAMEMLSGCEGTFVSVAAMLALRLNPEYAPRMDGELCSLAGTLAESKDDPEVGRMAGERPRRRRRCGGTADVG